MSLYNEQKQGKSRNLKPYFVNIHHIVFKSKVRFVKEKI